jgi:hypothetical protein
VGMMMMNNTTTRGNSAMIRNACYMILRNSSNKQIIRSIFFCTPEERRTLPPLSIPEADIPQKVIYNGPEKLRAAYVLERIPKIFPPIHPAEFEFEELVHATRQYYSRHQWEDFFDYFEEWKKLKAKAVKEKFKGHIVVPNPPKRTGKEHLEFERNQGKNYFSPVRDYWLKTWKPQPMFTQDDFDDNRYSINRCLHKRLFLIFREKATGKWKFPDARRKDPESMRATAQFKFQRDMGKRVLGHFNSHAPLNVYVKSAVDKTFFYHVFYMGGRPPFEKLSTTYDDHAWVTRQQMEEYDFVDEDYKKAVIDMTWDGMEVIN